MKEIYLIGLGNPGKKYYQNRHNIGFMLLENLSKKYNATFLLILKRLTRKNLERVY